MAKTRKKAAAKQTYIPGTEPKAIKEIESLFEEYETAKAERMTALEDELELKKKLLEALEKHRDKLPRNKDGQPEYKSVHLQKLAVLKPGEETLAVKRVKPPKQDE